MFLTFCSEEERKFFEESRSDMGTVLYKLFSYLYTISLSHSSGVVNTVFLFVSDVLYYILMYSILFYYNVLYSILMYSNVFYYILL